jgi:HlyD family type I secretion membrane fusion protein
LHYEPRLQSLGYSYPELTLVIASILGLSVSQYSQLSNIQFKCVSAHNLYQMLIAMKSSLNNSKNPIAIQPLQAAQPDNSKIPTTVHLLQDESDRFSDSPNTLQNLQTKLFLPPLNNWAIGGGLVFIVSAMIAVPIASILKYKVTVQGQATARPAGEVRIVQSAVQSQVKKIVAKGGQQVKQGEAIALLDRSKWEAKQRQLSSNIQQTKLQLPQLDTQVAALDRQIVAQVNLRNYSVAAAQAQLEGRQREDRDRRTTALSEVAGTKAQLQAAEATLASALVKQERYRTAAKANVISLDQLAQAELGVKQQAQEIAAAKAKLQRAQATLNPSSAEVRIATEQISQQKSTAQSTIAALNREKQALIQQKVEVQKRLQQDVEELGQTNTEMKQTTLVAPVSGTILTLKLRNPGQTLQPGEEVARIVPLHTPLDIKAALSPQDISKVEVGQRANIRVSACPYPDYGTLNGVVKQISQDTIKQQENSDGSAPPRKTSPDFYDITIKPDNLVFGRDRQRCAMQAGMEGRADIITKEETVLQFLLRKAKLMADV